jgi:hypothetical protein
MGWPDEWLIGNVDSRVLCVVWRWQQQAEGPAPPMGTVLARVSTRSIFVRGTGLMKMPLVMAVAWAACL